MPKKRLGQGKGVTKLPAVPGSTYSSRQGKAPSAWIKHGISDVSTHAGPSTNLSHPFSSEMSTNVPSMSLEEAVGLSQLLDSAFELPKDFDSVGGLTEDGLAVSSPEMVLKDVKKYVRERKPWLQEVDDALLERRRKEERTDPGCLIILPDNRVRSVDDQLNRRIRAMLLGEEAPETTHTAPKDADKKKEQQRRKVRNPWYVSPDQWFSEKALMGADEADDGFPYDNLEKATSATDEQNTEAKEYIDKTEQEEGAKPHRLTKEEKENLGLCDKFRQYVLKEGGRLPHFLQ